MKRSLPLFFLPLLLGGCVWHCVDGPAETPVAAGPAQEQPAKPGPEAKHEPPKPPKPVKVGAYSEHIAPDPEQRDVFAAATRGSEARNLRPLTVATQIVNGLNYDFRCVSEDGRRRYSVIIHRPLPQSGEAPRVVSIRELSATD